MQDPDVKATRQDALSYADPVIAAPLGSIGQTAIGSHASTGKPKAAPLEEQITELRFGCFQL